MESLLELERKIAGFERLITQFMNQQEAGIDRTAILNALRIELEKARKAEAEWGTGNASYRII